MGKNNRVESSQSDESMEVGGIKFRKRRMESSLFQCLDLLSQATNQPYVNFSCMNRVGIIIISMLRIT